MIPGVRIHSSGSIFRALLALVAALSISPVSSAALYSVNTSNDSGPGSLREAITLAQGGSGADTILIDDLLSINVLTRLPDVTGDNVTIQALGPGVSIRGFNLNNSEPGLRLMGNSNQLVGLIIIDFPGNGVEIIGDSNRVHGCKIGTNGSVDLGENGFNGIYVEGNLNEIGGAGSGERNIISGNGQSGIRLVGVEADIFSSSGNMIWNNFIGTDVTGTVAIENSGHGISIFEAHNTVIGGQLATKSLDPRKGDAPPTAGLGNLISGNGSQGIVIQISKGSVLTQVQGNIIGLNAAGLAGLGNNTGIDVAADENLLIGGEDVSYRNVIAGNGLNGIRLHRGSTTEINSNYFGTSFDGTAKLGGSTAIRLEDGSVRILNNVISGSLGVSIQNITEPIGDIDITGNHFGVDSSGVFPLPLTDDGIDINGLVGNIMIGGSGPNANVITNCAIGVDLSGTDVSGVTISQNAIFNNSSLGILLRQSANQGVAPPAIDSYDPLTGIVTGTAAAGSTVEIFVDDAEEGQLFIESIVVANKGDTNSFAGTQDLSAHAGRNVTATQTVSGNTSEFSDPVLLTTAGEGEGEACTVGPIHTADQDDSNTISLPELLRVIQLFNSGGFGCEPGTEDGYAPNNPDHDCCRHQSDYNPQDWIVDLSELLRVIQFFNALGYSYCPGDATEDGFCPNP